MGAGPFGAVGLAEGTTTLGVVVFFVGDGVTVTGRSTVLVMVVVGIDDVSGLTAGVETLVPVVGDALEPGLEESPHPAPVSTAATHAVVLNSNLQEMFIIKLYHLY